MPKVARSSRPAPEAPIQRDRRYRHIVLTYNNWKDHCPDIDVTTFDAYMRGHHDIIRMAWSHERGESGTDHIQGYIEFRGQVAHKQLMEILPNARWFPRKGTQWEAWEYAKKGDNTLVAGPWTYGEPPEETYTDRKPGLADYVKYAAEHGIPALCEAYPGAYARWGPGIERELDARIKREIRPKNVILMYGPTGVGKSYSFWHSDNNIENLGVIPSNLKWFNDARRRKQVLIEEFAGERTNASRDYLKQVLDENPLLVEVKNDHTYLVAHTVWMSTNLHPRNWYKNWDTERQGVDYNSFCRRVKEVHYWNLDQPLIYRPPDAIYKTQEELHEFFYRML